MAQNLVTEPLQPCGWVMPLVPESYDQSPLSDEEREALQVLFSGSWLGSLPKELKEARDFLSRLIEPLEDVWLLNRGTNTFSGFCRVMLQEMYERQMAFWQWHSDDWVELLRLSPQDFIVRYGRHHGRRVTRQALLEAAYLLVYFDRFGVVGNRFSHTRMAQNIFGSDLLAEQCERLKDAICNTAGFGYTSGTDAYIRLRRGTSLLMIYHRSPHLEALTPESVAAAAAASPTHELKSDITNRITVALTKLGLLEPSPEPVLPRDRRSAPPPEGVCDTWYAWCVVWLRKDLTDLSYGAAHNYVCQLLKVGRWLAVNHPEITSPFQWTEELALEYRAAVGNFTIGEYVSSRSYHRMVKRGMVGRPLSPRSINIAMHALRRFFGDLQNRPHSVDGAPARKLPLRFKPTDVFSTPSEVTRAVHEAEPRDIDLAVWRKLAGAAARLDAEDVRNLRWPLSALRALALLWITTARRPNELLRLRVDCIRREWDPNMVDEEGQSLEPGEDVLPADAGRQVCYLHIPAGKNRGPFWIWVPTYTADAVEAWKRERGVAQGPARDPKDGTRADLLFCQRNRRMHERYLNRVMIPLLCEKAGVPNGDVKGAFTAHRGRSTRLSLLRLCGMELEDLAEYAGHNDTSTLRHYVRNHPHLLHRKVAQADALSMIIEGLYDPEAAAAGKPAVRWFLGYDTDGEPQFCGLPAHHTCPHKLDCVRCGLYVGGEQAKLLQESENVQPIWSELPMTEAEQHRLYGSAAADADAAERQLEAMKLEPAPVPPNADFLTNPQGLSDERIEQLAEEGSEDAVRQLTMVVESLRSDLAEREQNSDGRNAIVGVMKKRLTFAERQLSRCQQHE